MPPRRGVRPNGLATLRRGGTVTELLFLFECATHEPPQLRPIAESLGLTVQAASHSFRRLQERGLAEYRDGRYRPSVQGVAWLHETFGELLRDLGERTERLHLIRSCRAVALDDLATGDRVTLGLSGGLLGARRGSTGPSRGRVLTSARRGDLVTVGELEGILPLPRGPIRIFTLPGESVDDPSVVEELRAVARTAKGLLAAPGLEPYHLLRRATDGPVQRFGVGPAVREASRVGVDSTVVLLESELPRFLEQFDEPEPPALTISRLGGRGGRSGSTRRGRDDPLQPGEERRKVGDRGRARGEEPRA